MIPTFTQLFLNTLLIVIQFIIHHQYHIQWLVNHHHMSHAMYRHIYRVKSNIEWILNHWPDPSGAPL